MSEAPKRFSAGKALERASAITTLGSTLGAFARENYPFAEMHTPASGDTLSQTLFLTSLISSNIYLGMSTLRKRNENQPIGTARWLAIGVIGALDAYITANVLGIVR